MRVAVAVPFILLWVVSSFGQLAKEARFRPVLDNGSVNVSILELPPHLRAESYQNTHDVIWIALTEADVSFADSENGKTEVSFRAGDVRFFRSFHAKSLANAGGTVFRGVAVELKGRGLASACDCNARDAKFVCGCSGATHLPQLWALGLGGITLAGTELAPGEKFRNTVERDDTLLVAVTVLTLGDEGDGSALPEVMRLQPGEAAWLKAGAHRLSNLGNAPARFVTVEF